MPYRSKSEEVTVTSGPSGKRRHFSRCKVDWQLSLLLKLAREKLGPYPMETGLLFYGGITPANTIRQFNRKALTGSFFTSVSRSFLTGSYPNANHSKVLPSA